MRSLTHLAFPLALFLGAFSSPLDLTVEIDELISEVNSARGSTCMCAEDAGYESKLECGELLAQLTGTEGDCMATVLEEHDNSGADYLACMTAAYSDNATCLAANINCDEGQVATCDQARDAALAGCTQIPESARQVFGVCVLSP